MPHCYSESSFEVVLTMDTLELVPFEGTQLQRVEDFDASKFHIKELRIKDLHKNLCKKSPYFRVRLDSQKRTSAAEPAERNGELRLRISDADYETCEEDVAAHVPHGLLTLPNPGDAEREISAAEEPPSNRTSKRKTRLPGKFRLDSNSFAAFPESYARYYRRSTSKSKVKHIRLKEKRDPVEAQFFEVPIEAHEVDLLQCDTAASGGERMALGSSKIADSNPCTPSERRAPTRPLKQIYHPPSSSQKRHPTPKQSRVTVDYSECMEVSTDTEPREGPRKTPVTSSTKWKHGSPDANTKEILPNGKRRTLDNGIKEKTRSGGSKVKERKSKPLENELQRTHNAQNGSTEEILPVRRRLNSPDASLEEILPTEKTRILESKLKEKKRRTTESKLKEKKSKILESELKPSYYAPQASTEDIRPMRWKHKTSDPSTGKGTLESKSKDKEDRTFESAGKETKRRTPEGESKRRHSASNASVEDILPMKWRRPKEKSPLESKWKEKINRTGESQLKEKTRRTVDDGSKLEYRDRDDSTEKIVPLKRKHSSFDASIEEILPTEKMKTLDSKLKDKTDKTSEIKSKEKKARILESELKQSSDVPVGKDGKPARRVSIPIRKLKGGYASEDGCSDLERDTDGPGVSHPTFATEMKHSNVVKCFWMGIPADFSSKHMPDHDQFIVLQDAQGLKWEANYLARKKGLSGGWRRFALDHHLEMGDTVVFELVKPLKFLVHITKVSGGENATHHPVRETPKKVLKPQGASVGTKRVSSLESALFSNRKRVNKDAEGKLPSKKPRLADGVKKDREGKEPESSVLRMPAAKPNRLFYPGAFKKKRRVARTATDHLGTQNSPLTFEDSEGEETPETKTVTSISKFKRLSSADDDRRDSGAGMDLQELVLTVYEEPAFVSSLEPQKAVPLSPKPGPKKKLRRVSYFYSTDEDQGNST